MRWSKFYSFSSHTFWTDFKQVGIYISGYTRLRADLPAYSEEVEPAVSHGVVHHSSSICERDNSQQPYLTGFRDISKTLTRFCSSCNINIYFILYQYIFLPRVEEGSLSPHQEPSNPTTEHIPGENHNSKRYIHSSVHCSTIYNSQDREAT